MTDFSALDILYEDNHLMVVNKHAGQLVQADAAGETGLEDAIKAFIRRRDNKPGDVFLGVVHRIDRPVSGAVVFAKTSKALVRLNEMIRRGEFDKRYWVVTESLLPAEEGVLVHHIVRDGKTNRSHAHTSPKKESKEARLEYRLAAGSTNYYLYEVRLLTGRHHQIRAQFSKEGAPIKGDLKYGARRSNEDGGISLHSRRVTLTHPVRKEPLTVTAPVPRGDNLWAYFEQGTPSTESLPAR
jgi:23S rRNA pseudouridine1911/1915/1917 synthase